MKIRLFNQNSRIMTHLIFDKDVKLICNNYQKVYTKFENVCNCDDRRIFFFFFLVRNDKYIISRLEKYFLKNIPFYYTFMQDIFYYNTINRSRFEPPIFGAFVYVVWVHVKNCGS